MARFEETFLFWKDPDLSFRLVQDLVKLSLCAVPLIFYCPLKSIAIFALWAVILQKVSFIRHLGNILQSKAKQLFLSSFEYSTHKILKIEQNIGLPDLDPPLVGLFNEFLANDYKKKPPTPKIEKNAKES